MLMNFTMLSLFEGIKILFLLISLQTVKKEVSLYLSDGHWFVSFYNDFGEAQQIGIRATADGRAMGHGLEGCPRGCSGPANGQCVLGRCQCKPGFGGEDCSEGKSTLHYTSNMLL